jgi:hypothetical protein
MMRSIPSLIGDIIPYVIEDVLETIQANDCAVSEDNDTMIETINYEYGTLEEIKTKLQRKDGDDELRTRKYPCILLITDLPEPKGQGTKYNGKARFAICIVHHTTFDRVAEQRYEKVIEPILYPIYESFIENILNSGLFAAYDVEDIPHNKIDRVDMGKTSFLDLTEGSYDYLDGIEMSNFELTPLQALC